MTKNTCNCCGRYNKSLVYHQIYGRICPECQQQYINSGKINAADSLIVMIQTHPCKKSILKALSDIHNRYIVQFIGIKVIGRRIEIQFKSRYRWSQSRILVRTYLGDDISKCGCNYIIVINSNNGHAIKYREFNNKMAG